MAWTTRWMMLLLREMRNTGEETSLKALGWCGIKMLWNAIFEMTFAYLCAGENLYEGALLNCNSYRPLHISSSPPYLGIDGPFLSHCSLLLDNRSVGSLHRWHLFPWLRLSLTSTSRLSPAFFLCLSKSGPSSGFHPGRQEDPVSSGLHLKVRANGSNIN